MANLFSTQVEQPQRLCGKIVRCWDFGYRPCVRPEGHDLEHNPFSDSPSVQRISKQQELVAV